MAGETPRGLPAAAFRRGACQRNIDRCAAELIKFLRRPQLRGESPGKETRERQALQLPATLNTECIDGNELGQVTSGMFTQPRLRDHH